MRRFVCAVFLIALGSPGWGALLRTSVASILEDPDAYHEKALCVQGPAEDVREKTSAKGNPYILFNVREGNEVLKVFTFGRGVIPEDGPVTVCGVFNKEKRVGGGVVHNELTGVFVGTAPAGDPGTEIRPSFSGRVMRVADGDTLNVRLNDWDRPVRFFGIDCPERGQPFGNKAREFTRRRASGRNVTVLLMDIDKYERIVGWVLLPDGALLNRELVREGLAWWYRRYAPDNKDLERLEDAVRRDRKGLWRDGSRRPPWDYRRPRRRRK